MGTSHAHGFELDDYVFGTTDIWDTTNPEVDMDEIEEHIPQTPPGHPDPAQYHQDLGNTLTVKYLDGQRYPNNGGDLKDLQAGIANLQKAVNLTPSGHPEDSRREQDLSWALAAQYRKLGPAFIRIWDRKYLRDLEAAVQSNLEKLTPAGHPERAGRIEDLAVSLGNRYRRMGDLEDLEAALRHNLEAVDLTPTEHPDRPPRLQNLATSFRNRYLRFGNKEDLEESMQRNQEAVDLAPAYNPQCLTSLGASFTDRYQRLGNLEDGDAALFHHVPAVDLTPRNHPDRAERLGYLAISFRAKYQREGDLRNLGAAMERYREAIELTLLNHPSRAEYLRGLATCFMDWYERLKRPEDLEDAMRRSKEAMDFIPVDHPDRPEFLNTIGVCFRLRYQRLGDLQDIEVSIQRLQKAVDLTPADHPQKAVYLRSLAASLGAQYRQLRGMDDLEASLQGYQEAVSLMPTDHPERTKYLQSLAEALEDRFKGFGDLQDLEAIVQTNLEAVDLTPADHPDQACYLQALALSYTYRYRRLGDPKDLENVSQHYSASFTTLASNSPASSWTAALNWASFLEEFQPSNVLSAYEAAFNLLPGILWMGHSIPEKHDTIRRLDIGPIISAATKSGMKLGQLRFAVEILEQGLGITFQQMLQLRPDVNKLSQSQAAELEQLSSQLYSGTALNPTAVTSAREHLLDKIHKQPGLEYFLLPKPYSALCHAAQNGPVIILNTHVVGCGGIIILNPTSEPVHLSFPSFTLEDLQSQRKMLKNLLGGCDVRTRKESDPIRLLGWREGFTSKTVKECFEELLSWLWKNIVNPVYQILTSHGIHKGRLWWLPRGAFTGLPLHASPSTEQFIHSYTATLNSLLEAQNKKSLNDPIKFGVVGVTHTSLGGSNYLQGVEQEVRKICSVIRSPNLQCLEGEHATPNAVKRQLEDCSWVHLACHGIQDSVDPVKSHLLLYDGILELENILRFPRSHAEFVFLSACQTAMG
ncbi:CHAT domain-containing protein, partial [Mycena maculata]